MIPGIESELVQLLRVARFNGKARTPLKRIHHFRPLLRLAIRCWAAASRARRPIAGGCFVLFLIAAGVRHASASGHSLHFFGTGSGDVDRVKIRIDDPTTSLPGPPADVGATDFTAEFWIMAAAADNSAPAVSCGVNTNWVNGNVVLDRDRLGQPRNFGVSIAGGKIVFGVTSDAGSLTLCGVSNVLDNAWHHIAVQRRRSDGNLWLFVDGALDAQSAGPPGDVSYPDNAVPANVNDPYLVIGAEKFDTAPGHAFHGFFDELRLSTRLRYASAFPRPKSSFLPDAYTAALYHFDEGDGNPVHDGATAVGGPSNGISSVGGPNGGPKWSTVSPFDFGAVQIAFKQVVTGASSLVDIANAGDGSGRLFLVQQTGMIRVVQNGALLGTPFLDIHTLVQCCGEQGLLALAFDPNYKSNGLFYVYYTAPTPGNIGGQEILARYQRSAADPNVADPTSGTVLLAIPHPDQTNHNGGKVAFGPDGYLYFSVGDGGGGYDPFHAGQNLSDRRAKLHRIDVHSLPYTIPPTNPYAGSTCTTACPEIWAYGLRNPFRISFDRLTGDLFVGDVGQDLWEEIDFQPAGAAGGANYGWSVCEGNHLAGSLTQLCTLTGDVRPIIEYGHDAAGGNVVTGGYRYRGTALPMLAGSYIYADFGSGHVWVAQINEDGTWSTQLVVTQGGISTFGEDENGELYASDYGSGTLYKLVAPDSDGDGLPDWWETTYFGVAGTTPGADPDGDGLTNLQEYQLGRDPRLFSPLTVAGDLSGDGKAEVVWRRTSGANVVWQFDALGNIVSSGLAGVPTTWYLGAIADINGDSRSDLIWVNPGTGQVLAWLQNGAITTSTVTLPGIGVGSGWSLEASGDLDGDGYRDLIWRKTDGTVVGWKMINGAVASTVVYPSAPPSAWDLVGTGDFDLDAKAEILWRHIPDNAYYLWRYADTGNVTSQFVGAPGGTWTVQLIADFDGDGKADLFWRDGSGANAIWLGGDPANVVFPPGVGVDWTPVAAGNYDGSARAGILWMRNDGIVAQWSFTGAASMAAPSVRFLTGIPAGWQAINP